MKTPREEIISLLRGYFSCPVIATLAELNCIRQMIDGPFRLTDFDSIPCADALEVVINYLRSLGLIEATASEQFQLTQLGQTVFKRAGAFSIIHSYRQHIEGMREYLLKGEINASVNRKENVIGSAQLHRIKFFPQALRMIEGHDTDCLVDLGCGNGEFLRYVQPKNVNCRAVGVDIAVEAINSAKSTCSLDFIQANAFDVDEWSSSIPPQKTNIVISMWFVLHEFSNGKKSRLEAFFNSVFRRFPNALLLIGEITKVCPHDLANARNSSIMPEFLFFHSVSKQGVLAWKEWQELVSAIPYVVQSQQLFDSVESTTGGAIPSSFIWLLRPSNSAPATHPSES